MTDRELSMMLRELACNQDTPLCEKWTREWRDDSTIDELIDKFLRGQDFCIKNNYPSLDFIREHVSMEDLHRNHIYIDEEMDISNVENGFYVFLGHCKAKVRASGFLSVTVYCRHDSEVDVYARDGALVFVRYFENSTGSCKSDEWSRLHRYDNNC